VGEERSRDLVALNDTLQALSAQDARKGQVVELRFFGGLSVKEAAEALKVSPETVMRDWKFAKAWLARELRRGNAKAWLGKDSPQRHRGAEKRPPGVSFLPFPRSFATHKDFWSGILNLEYGMRLSGRAVHSVVNLFFASQEELDS